jgi:Icc-related predicted phosphoesterase
MRKLSILHFSDTHNRHMAMYYRLQKPVDVVVFSGDLTGIGSHHEVEDFLEWYATFPAHHRLFIAGNHDLCFDPQRGFNNGTEVQDWVKEEISRFELGGSGNYYLQNSGCEIYGVNFWGSPITPWFHGDHWAFNKHRTDEEIGQVWKKIPDDVDVLITHGPPAHFCDLVYRDKLRAGCTHLSWHIRRVKPLLNLFGHIHEGYGYERDVDTHYFNGSILNLNYEVQNEPWLIEADFDQREVRILNKSKTSKVYE